jgi:zinc transport system permease protein
VLERELTSWQLVATTGFGERFAVFDFVIGSLDDLIVHFTQLWPAGTIFSFEHTVRGMLAVMFVCFICGAMGALVVGNRMAFFSDALAHCAFAGVALGLVMALAMNINPAIFQQSITLIMVCFGIVVGLLIAFVRERTGLASDTVIGVFYAAAIGLGAVFMGLAAGRRQLFSIEQFIFGDPNTAETWAIVCLALLATGVAAFLAWLYNPLILASTSTSLALSRGVRVRLCQYLFIVLLGLMVNLSIQIVGALLINGLLIVPAAAAANLARNLRQMFWYSIGLTMVSGVGGYIFSWEITCRFPGQRIGTSGTIVVLAVLLFVGSMLIGRRLRERMQQPALGEKESV